MTDLRTISRAILSIALAAAFLMMTVASGLHYLAHLADQGHRHAFHPSASLPGAAGPELTQGTPLDRGYNGGDICFFCIHGSSVTFSFAPIHLQPELVDLPARCMPAVPDVIARSTTLPSLRAPPVLA